MKYSGSCHCQEVKFEIETKAPINGAMSCNCSICARKGHLLTIVPKAKLSLISGEQSLGDYVFGKKIVHHQFCKTCGVGTFGHGKGPDGSEMAAINVRCLENFDFSKIEIQQYDGKSL